MKIAIVNDIHVGKHLERNGTVRASSHLVEDMLDNFLNQLVQQHTPDVLINLGDLIRSESKETDLSSYQRVMAHFKNVPAPVIHLLGNHELKKLSAIAIEDIWQQFGFQQKSYGYKDFGQIGLIWIGLALDPEDHKAHFLPVEQLQWLKEQLNQSSQPMILFTHCPIDDHAITGNFFYQESEKRANGALFLENQQAIKNILLESKCVIAVLQAHLHYFHTRILDGIPFITCPAMGDNICGPHVTDNVPEIYTILTLEKTRLIAKVYSGRYCFAGFETETAQRAVVF